MATQPTNQIWMADAKRRYDEWLATGESFEHFAARVQLGFEQPALRYDRKRWDEHAMLKMKADAQWFVDRRDDEKNAIIAVGEGLVALGAALREVNPIAA